ncbi:MAG TPA: hypothetical protein VG317_10000 [Pseudonocardiaceae bacterium]|jgi:hypothetical protein|nr:hypothetical protein [Pseudonocardiaceae bacterium]
MTNGLVTFLGDMIPLLALMFCPVWLPMVGWLCGVLRDAIVGDSTSGRRRAHTRAVSARSEES